MTKAAPTNWGIDCNPFLDRMVIQDIVPKKFLLSMLSPKHCLHTNLELQDEFMKSQCRDWRSRQSTDHLILDWMKGMGHESVPSLIADLLASAKIAKDEVERKVVPDLEQFEVNALKLCDLPVDWDGEGAQPIDRATVQAAMNFMRQCASQWLSLSGKQLPLPEVDPVPNGSVDLDWSLGDRALLVNVPTDTSERFSFYGRNACGELRGKICAEGDAALLLGWIVSE